MPIESQKGPEPLKNQYNFDDDVQDIQQIQDISSQEKVREQEVMQSSEPSSEPP